MVVDTSAIIAFLEGESLADRIGVALASAERVQISAATLVEAGIVLEARRGEFGGRELDVLLHRLGAYIEPVNQEHAEAARAAWREFGKGRHPAGLNFGDCFAYALSVVSGDPLLFVGEDFARTDVAVAPY